MKAFTKNQYGGPEILQLENVEKPRIKENHILVKVMANSANPADWHILRGEPFLARLAGGLFRPKEKILGADFAGIVEEIGKNVSHIGVGDHVFGGSLKGGAFAEYTCVPANFCAKIPADRSFAEFACVPIAGLTALQAVITHGKLKKGESVLINGSSGGVGHLAVQIAKAYGADVTAVCSSKNIKFVKTLGADKIIPYDTENIHKHSQKYDLVIDTNGNLTHEDYLRMGKGGVMVGFTTMKNLVSVLLKNMLSRFKLIQFTASANTADLETLAILIAEEKVRVNIEKTFSYQHIPDAIRYIEAMHTRGKVAMIWDK